MDTLKYIHFKHQQKNEEKQRLQQSQDNRNSRVMKPTGQGLGHGNPPDMRDAMRKVNEFNYTPTEDEIHYRRLTSGTWIDKPASTPTK